MRFLAVVPAQLQGRQKVWPQTLQTGPNNHMLNADYLQQAERHLLTDDHDGAQPAGYWTHGDCRRDMHR